MLENTLNSADEEKRLERLAEYKILDTPPEKSFDRIVAMAARLFNAPIALISLVSRDRQWFKARCGLEPADTHRSVSFCAYAMFEDSPMVVCDATKDNRFQNNPLVTGDVNIRFYVGAPLRTPDGSPLGTLCVIDRVARPQPARHLLQNLEDLAFLAMEQLEFRLAIAAEHRALLDRQMAQEQLCATTNHLEEAQRLAHLGSWQYDLATNSISWSDETYRLFDLPAQSPVGNEQYLSLLSPEDRVQIQALSKECIETGKPYCTTQTVTRSDGSQVFLEARGRVEYSSDSIPLRLLGTVLDVTARVKADELLRQANQELEQRVEQRTELLAQSNTALMAEVAQHKLTQSIVAGQNQVLRKIACGAPIAEVFATLIQFGEHEIGGKISGGILLKEPNEDVLKWAFAPSLPPEIRDGLKEVKIAAGEGSAGSAAFYRKPIVFTHIDKMAWPGAALFMKYMGARSLASTPILDSANQVLGTVSFACPGDQPTDYELRVQEICASLAAVALIRDKENSSLRQWELMFQNASWGMALASAKTGRLLAMNPAYAAMLGYAPSELSGESVFDAYGQQLMPAKVRESDCFIYNPHPSYESQWTRRDGAKIPVWIDIVPIFDAGGSVLYWATNVRDITEQNKSGAQLEEAFRQLQFLADFSPQIFWTADASGKLTYFNEKWFDYSGTTFEESMGWGWTPFLHPDDLQNCIDIWMHSLKTGIPYETEIRVKRASDGMFRWQLSRATAFRDTNGEILKWFGTLTDIHQQKTETERLALEVAVQTQELRRSLSEKDTLLKEIHHRVKNNLQVISSLLRMQASSLKDSSAIAALKESQQRVRSMALIHERLYSGHQMHSIDFGEYTQRLVQELFYSYATSTNGTVSRLEIGHILLNIDQAIPCGLILNELVTNALKYAYPNGGGEVLIELKEASTGRVRLSVSDQGVGLPQDWIPENATSLGLPIVDLLAKQLGGRLEIKSGPGASFIVDFPLPGTLEYSFNAA